ncbi:MAG: PAS domain S-box protein, partial [Leptospiraceae bacterium]|nr:PAS domain S-box protein [Leptospiraceae bacterium]
MQDWRGTFIRLPLIAVIIVIVPGISLVIALILYGQYEYNLDRVRQHLVQDLQLEAALIQDSELSRAIPISTETGSDRLNLRQHFAIRVEPSIAGNSGFDLYYPPGRTHVPVDSISVNRSGMMQALADLTEPDGHFWLSNADGDERSVLVVYRSLPDRPTKILVMDDVSGLRAAYFKALYILVIVLALFLVGGAVLVIWLSTPLIHRLEASEKNYHTLFQSHTEGILLVTMSGMIENCNRQARRMLGAPRRLIIGRHILDFAPEVQPDGVLSRNVLTQQMRPENSAGGRFLLWKIKRYNGTLFDCNLSVKSVPLEGRQVYIVTLQDISRRRAAEEELRRTNRSLKILSESYALLAEAGNESHFLHDICRIIVEHGGYHLAWVALYSSQSDLRPVAQFGSRHGYLESIPLTWQLTSAERDGMFAEVLHTGRPRVFRGWNDLDHSRPTEEDSHSTWRDEVRRSRYRTMIILPLIHEEQRLGVLCILAIDRTAFDLPDHEFLVEVANDIAFAISVLRIRNKHHEADLELRKSEARLARAQELARMGSWEWNLSTNEIYWSDEHFRVLGVKREVFPITYRNILHRIHPEDRNEWRRTLRNLLQGNR